MSPERVSFEVERFERVPAGAGVVLFRVAGRWTADTSRRARAPRC